MDRQGKQLLEFGPFRMDLEECVLMRDQETITPSPKAFETLAERSSDQKLAHSNPAHAPSERCRDASAMGSSTSRVRSTEELVLEDACVWREFTGQAAPELLGDSPDLKRHLKQFLLVVIFTGTLPFLNGCGSSSPSPPPPAADFSIEISPASVSTQVGGTTLPVSVSLKAVNGFTGMVTVTASGFPNGINSSPAASFMLTAGTPQQVTFSAPAAAGTFTVQFQGTSGTLSRSASATLSVTPPQSPYLVSASYYPWYNANSWEYAECFNGTLRGELLPAQLPVLGKYDSGQEDVVTQQIAWSAAAGINVWDLEWVMPDDLLDNNLQKTVLTNPHIGDIHLAMFYDYGIRFNSDNNLTSDKVTTILSDFRYLAANYFSHPSYLKVGQGKPVVFFYSSLNLQPVSAVQQMVASIRQSMSAAGFSVYLIGDEYYPLRAPDPARIGNWDAIFGYNPYATQAGYSDDNGFLALQATMYQQYQAVAQQLGVDFIPSLVPGFNDRAVRRTCANNPALARRTSANAAEGSMFASFLKDLALPYANNNKLKMIHITTFNEWHEDTQVEPSIITSPTTVDTSPTGSQYTQALVYQGYGTTYLDILRSEIAAAKP
jgi:glycoprotein endo-alpha-1,2-mannosidase